jgi:hypothetical protein
LPGVCSYESACAGVYHPVILTCSLLLAIASAPLASNLNKDTALSPAARRATSFGNALFVIGGNAGDRNDNEAYDIETDRWTRLVDLTTTATTWSSVAAGRKSGEGARVSLQSRGY